MKSLSIKLGVLTLGLLMFAAMPRTASADSYTLDGVSLDFISAGPGDSIDVVVPPSLLAIGLEIDNLADFTIPNLFVDDTTNGTVYDLKNDLVVADEFNLFGPSFAAIDYSSVSVATPEPPEVALLGLGLLALALGSKKMRAAKGRPATA
jgi:hypothetical protein